MTAPVGLGRVTYLLDTNVISELVRPEPNPRVIAWVEGRSVLDLHLSVLTLGAAARRDGRPLPTVDGLLLATAAVHGLTLATRDRRDCAGRGVDVVDPWREAG